jgi:hypothetical protein
MSTKTELLKTSAQDQFARWAKLRRSVDRGLADLEKLSTHRPLLSRTPWAHEKTDSEVASNKTAFSVKFNTLLWMLTTGLQFLVGWWYRKSAIFYLPQGWFGPLGWWLSFPFAPAGELICFQRMTSRLTWLEGSVSVGVWQMACKRVIKIGERVAKDLLGKCHLRSCSNC